MAYLTLGKRLLARRLYLVLSCILTGLLIAVHLEAARPSISLHVSNIDADVNRTLVGRAVNNTLVVVPVNTGMLYWADNLLCSLQRTDFDSNQVLFWALDARAKTLLEAQGRATYFDASLLSVATNANRNGDTRDYRKMMRERPKFFVDVLSAGYDILMIDADTVWFQSPLVLRDESVDAVFSTDAREFYQDHDAFRDAWRRGDRIPPVCAGVFWMKASAKTVRLYQDMLAVFNGGLRTLALRLLFFQDDQRGLDVLLNDGRTRLVEPLPRGITADMLKGRYRDHAEMRVRLLDQTEVVNGHLLKNRPRRYQESLANLRSEGEDRIAVHLNWNPRDVTKEDGSKEMGFWLLDDGGDCKDP
ncbi:hypothetical protein M8818_006319 [Zalaria obscura]|uniref:Uncharacterized protein n=1 Tax=Zalaria obscura TaxID=2024903 RepID=A0ACC3S9E9_9PEZI